MKQIVKACRVAPGESVDLKKRPTRIDPLYASKDDYRALLDEHIARLSKQQELLFSANSHAVLLIFQAMDAGGKDGCIRHVLSGVNPQGCRVTSFAHPTPVELKHDFLWRTTRELPERGMIGIFNRSYYEEVLIVRVHPEILAAEAIPGDGHHDAFWKFRFRSITGLERHLHENGTRIAKIFLHISKDEQKKRLLERIDISDKNWKIQRSDIEERKHWPAYRKAYEATFEATSSADAPWYVVPADDKPTARLIVSQILLELLDGLDLKQPKPNGKRRQELAALRAELEQD